MLAKRAWCTWGEVEHQGRPVLASARLRGVNQTPALLHEAAVQGIACGSMADIYHKSVSQSLRSLRSSQDYLEDLPEGRNGQMGCYVSSCETSFESTDHKTARKVPLSSTAQDLLQLELVVFDTLSEGSRQLVPLTTNGALVCCNKKS